MSLGLGQYKAEFTNSNFETQYKNVEINKIIDCEIDETVYLQECSLLNYSDSSYIGKHNFRLTYKLETQDIKYEYIYDFDSTKVYLTWSIEGDNYLETGSKYYYLLNGLNVVTNKYVFYEYYLSDGVWQEHRIYTSDYSEYFVFPDYADYVPFASLLFNEDTQTYECDSILAKNDNDDYIVFSDIKLRFENDLFVGSHCTWRKANEQVNNDESIEISDRNQITVTIPN